MPRGYVIYSGVSELDGRPIVAIATGFSDPSSNRKLGTRLQQVWILRGDINPVEAVLTGEDRSICGDCRFRGKAEARRVTDRTCYVPVFQAPFAIWNCYARSSSYTLVSEDQITALFAGCGVRLGAYGDPAAIPPRVWQAVTAKAAFWTGYTHQWRTCDPIFARWCMASCETEAEREMARALGYRTFRTTWRNAWADRLDGEIVCPASAEAGKKTTCDQCRVCGGNNARGSRTDVVITMHGVGAKRFRTQHRVAA